MVKIKEYPSTCINRIEKSINVHFTNMCHNKCFYCVDALYKNECSKNTIPTVHMIYKSIIDTIKGNDAYHDVLFLGGEPLLFLDELLLLVKKLKTYTNLKLYTTTSLPLSVYKNKDRFFELLENLDGINLSMQHMDEETANKIRGVNSTFNKNNFLKEIPKRFYKKIRINLNILKPYLYTKEDIINNVKFYKDFNSIKLSELQHRDEYFISFSDIFDVKFKPAFGKCMVKIDIKNVEVLLKRSCFMCCDINPKSIEVLDISLEMLKQKFKIKKHTDKFIYNDKIENNWI